jgi:hypothetical protein
MSCILLHPMHNLPVANEIVRRNIPVTPEIDALPRRKRVRAIVSLMVQHNLEAYRHRYTSNAQALAEADTFEKGEAKAFSASRTIAGWPIIAVLTASWRYQTSDHRDYDNLPTNDATARLMEALEQEVGASPGKLPDAPAYQQAARTYWTSDVGSIQTFVDAATAARAVRKASRPARATVTTTVAPSSGEAERILRSLVSDIEAMNSGVVLTLDDDSESEGFGPFSEIDENRDGTIIAWPNLRIMLEEAQKFLAGQQALPLPTPATPVAQPTPPAPAMPSPMAAFVNTLAKVKGQFAS